MRFQKTVSIAMGASLLFVASRALAQPVSDSDFISISAAVLPVGKDTSFSVTVHIETKTPDVAAITIPLTFAGHPALAIDTTVMDPNGQVGVNFVDLGRPLGFGGMWWASATSNVDNSNSSILLGLISFGTFMPDTSGDLCNIFFRLNATQQPGIILVDSTILPPASGVILVDAAATHYRPAFEAGRICVCPYGDLTADARVSLVDIVFLVNYLLRAGPAPALRELANVNGDCQPDLADAVYLVNYLFRRGAAPVRGCPDL